MTSGRCSSHRLDQPLGGHLDAEVDHLEAVVREHDVDQVLADVVDVALDRREQHLAARRARRPLHVRLEEGDRRLHHLGRLQHLGDDQLVGVEQPPDLVHAGHQRAVDRSPSGVGAARVGERGVEIVLEPDLASPRRSPARAARRAAATRARGPAAALARPRKCAVKAATAASPAALSPSGRKISASASRRSSLGDLGVARQPLGVDDRGVEPGLRRVVEEDRVEHLAAGGRQAERDVGDAEHGLRERELGLDRAHALDRRRRRADVGLVAGAAGEDQRVEPEVLRRHRHLLGQDRVAAPRDLDLALDRDRHPLLVDQADHQRGAEAARERHDLARSGRGRPRG